MLLASLNSCANPCIYLLFSAPFPKRLVVPVCLRRDVSRHSVQEEGSLISTMYMSFKNSSESKWMCVAIIHELWATANVTLGIKTRPDLHNTLSSSPEAHLNRINNFLLGPPLLGKSEMAIVWILWTSDLYCCVMGEFAVYMYFRVMGYKMTYQSFELYSEIWVENDLILLYGTVNTKSNMFYFKSIRCSQLTDCDHFIKGTEM